MLGYIFIPLLVENFPLMFILIDITQWIDYTKVRILLHYNPSWMYLQYFMNTGFVESVTNVLMHRHLYIFTK